MFSPQIIVLLSSMVLSAATGGWLAKLYYTAEISDMRADKARAAQEASRLNRSIELLGIELAGAVSERDAARKQKRDVRFRTVAQEVIKYVKSPVPKCDIAAGWVRVHNAAAGSGMPEDTEATGAVDDTARSVADDTVLEVVTSNYQICTESSDKLIALQEWAAGLQRLE